MLTWETERILLRPLILADLDDLYQLYRDPLIMRYITGQPRSYERTRERLLSHIADFRQYGFGLYATMLKSTGALIGRCGMQPVPARNGLEGNLAWMFARPYWGQGLATEFARAMIPYGFPHTPVTRMFSDADPSNLASIRVMQKAGMTFAHSDKYHVEYEVHRPPLPCFISRYTCTGVAVPVGVLLPCMRSSRSYSLISACRSK